MGTTFKLDVLIKGITNMPKISDSVNKATAKIGKSFEKMSKVADANSKAFARSDVAVDRLSRSLGIGLVAAFGAATVAGVKFQVAVADLSALTGIQGQELVTLSEAAINMSTKYGQSASKVAEALKLVASGKSELIGVSGALEQVTENAVILSKAARLDLRTSTQSLVTSLNQFNFGAEESARVINVLAIGAKLGASEITDTSQAIIRAGVAMRLSNVSFEQGNAAIQVLAKSGLKGVIAGTQLKTALLRMQTQIDEVNPKVVGLEQALNTLAAANLTGAELTRLFGLEALATGSILIENRALLKKWTAEFKGTNEATKQATTNMDTLLESGKRLGAQMTKLLINVFNKISPALRSLSDNLGTLISEINQPTTPATAVLVKTLTFSLKFLAIALAVVIAEFKIFQFLRWKAAVGPALIAVNSLNKAIVVGLVSALRTASIFVYSWGVALWTAAVPALTAAASAAWTFTAALLANPITWIVVGIIALAAAVGMIIAKWDTWGETVANWLGPVGLAIGQLQILWSSLGRIGEAFKMGGIKQGIISIGKTFVSMLLHPVSKLLELISHIPGLKGIASDAMSSIQSFQDELQAPTEAELGNTTIVNPSNSQTLEVQMTIDSEGRPNIEKASSSNSGLNFTANLGYSTAFAGV